MIYHHDDKKYPCHRGNRVNVSATLPHREVKSVLANASLFVHCAWPWSLFRSLDICPSSPPCFAAWPAPSAMGAAAASHGTRRQL